MSMEFANTSLAGCAPFRELLEETKELHRALEGLSLGNALLPGFDSLDVPSFWMHGGDNRDYAQCIKTDDGKGWYCARMFVYKHGGCLVLFPWHGDRTKKDGSLADPLIQIHRFGFVSKEQILQVLQPLTAWAVERKKKFSTELV